MPPFLHCRRLKRIEDPERSQPALLAGGASLEIHLSQVFQKLLCSKGTDASSDTDMAWSPSVRRCRLWPNHLLSSFLQAALSHHKNTSAPYSPPFHAASLISPSQLHSQSTLSYWSQLLLQPTWQRALTYPQGPIPLLLSSPCASLPAHLLMPSSSSYSQLSVCKGLLRFCSFWPQAPNLIWHPEHPYIIWHPRPVMLRCLADRRKTSFPPMCTAPKMFSRPRREE